MEKLRSLELRARQGGMKKCLPFPYPAFLEWQRTWENLQKKKKDPIAFPSLREYAEQSQVGRSHLLLKHPRQGDPSRYLGDVPKHESYPSQTTGSKMCLCIHLLNANTFARESWGRKLSSSLR